MSVTNANGRYSWPGCEKFAEVTRFCREGINAGKPGPCPDPEKAKARAAKAKAKAKAPATPKTKKPPKEREANKPEPPEVAPESKGPGVLSRLGMEMVNRIRYGFTGLLVGDRAAEEFRGQTWPETGSTPSPANGDFGNSLAQSGSPKPANKKAKAEWAKKEKVLAGFKGKLKKSK